MLPSDLTDAIFVCSIISSLSLTQSFFFFQNPSQLLQVRILKVKKNARFAWLFLFPRDVNLVKGAMPSLTKLAGEKKDAPLSHH